MQALFRKQNFAFIILAVLFMLCVFPAPAFGGQESSGSNTVTRISVPAGSDTVSIDVVMDSSVVYNGKKHLPVINGSKAEKEKKGTVRDLKMTVSCDLLAFSEVGYIIKNNRDAKGGAGKLIIKFKASKGTDSKRKSLINTVNRYLKKRPLDFNVTKADIGELEVEATLNNSRDAVKRVTVMLGGERVKLTSRNYTAAVEDGVITVKGRGNFTGTWSSNESGKKDEPIDPTEPEKLDQEDSGIRQLMADLSLRLLGSADISTDIKNGKNLAISAYSIENALGMTANGAKGDTLTEMENALFGGYSISEFNSEIKKYNSFVSSLNGSGFETNLANGIWVNGAPVDSGFEDIVKDCYNASVSSRAFDGSTVNEINGFVSDATRGMINKVIDELEEDDVMVLVNALYLAGVWENTFDEENIIEGQKFRAYDGSIENVTMLQDTENSRYFRYRGADGIIKDLQGGKGRFVAILPAEGESPLDYLGKCDKNMMATIEANIVGRCNLTTRFPEFEYEYDTSLNRPLMDAGVKKAFSPGADFSGFLSGDGSDICIDEVIHKTHVKVDREGAKAAAVTGIIAKATSTMDPIPRKTVIFDRPFIYMLTDENYVPVFVGVVNSVS